MWNFFSLIFGRKESTNSTSDSKTPTSKLPTEKPNMKHPFQIVLSDKEGKSLFVAFKHHIQVYSEKGTLIGSWTDEIDSSDIMRKQQEDKIKALREQKDLENKEKQIAKSSKRSSDENLDEARPSKKAKAGKEIKIPKIPTPGPGAPPIYNYIRSLKLSHNGNYLIASTGVDKAVAIFHIDLKDPTNVLKMIKRQPFPKRPCAITTDFNDEHLIIADKFGDVYTIPLKDEKVETDMNKFEPLLGHVSMLSDVTLGKDDSDKEFILTADRDEHIKVSYYQKAYIMKRMLFGHREFISNLIIPEWNRNLLISGGGDDFICLWNWTNDENYLIQKIQIRELVEKYLTDAHLAPERFLTENSKREISVSKILSINEKKLILVLIENTKAILVFQMNEEENYLKHVQTLEASANVTDVTNDSNGHIIAALDIDSDEKLLEYFEIKDDNTIGLVPKQDDLVKAISNGNISDIKSRDEIYPLYHVHDLRKRSEH